jgi:hypothetical protein
VILTGVTLVGTTVGLAVAALVAVAGGRVAVITAGKVEVTDWVGGFDVAAGGSAVELAAAVEVTPAAGSVGVITAGGVPEGLLRLQPTSTISSRIETGPDFNHFMMHAPLEKRPVMRKK